MPQDLLQLVSEELLPTLIPLGFHVTHSEVAEVFDNASVILEAPVVRMHVIRERGIVGFELGSTVEPNTWFDSTLLIEYLGLSSTNGIYGEDARTVLRGAGHFLTALWTELVEAFDSSQFATTRGELEALARERAARLFGA